jgi:hypothetical protein
MQTEVLPRVTKSESICQNTKYFYRAYETFMMLRESSQIEDAPADLKNVDILRL